MLMTPKRRMPIVILAILLYLTAPTRGMVLLQYRAGARYLSAKCGLDPFAYLDVFDRMGLRCAAHRLAAMVCAFSLSGTSVVVRFQSSTTLLELGLVNRFRGACLF
jgi:hypothetical protein